MTGTGTVTGAGTLPAVRAEVVADVVGGLTPRLRKRLDGAVAKLDGLTAVRDGDDWRIRIDEESELVLHAPGGVVASAADVRCGCLLAPGCLHRAAAVSAADLAEPADPGSPGDPEPPGEPGESGEAGEPAAPADPAAPGEPAPAPPEPAPAPPAAPAPLAAREADAVRQLRAAAAEVLAAGIGGAGGVLQAEVLRVAHQARLLGLHRPAALAVALVTRLRAARARQAEHRLGDLAAVLRDLLEVTTALLGPAPAAGLRGTARQTYREGGGLRLYGLFAEPVLTATHAGVVAWAVDPAGRLSTVSDVTPHSGADAAAEAALTAGSRPLRLGDASLSHREFSRAGLVVQSATRTESGRLGAGAKVRAVRAAGADWQEQPSAALWSEPVASQADRALAAGRLPEEDRPAGADLLFLDVTVVGAGPVPGEVLAECAGLTLALAPAAAHPALPCRDNQALLASVPGLRLRVIGRLERAAHPRLRLLAAGQVPGPAGLRLPDARAGRVGLGLERLQQADLPSVPELSAPELVEPAPRPSAGAVPEPPVEVLGRRLEQAVTAGRRALAPGPAVPEAARLRAAGLGTAADLLTALCAAAADRERDVFGRLREGDPLAFALAWLAASCYREELATALCADAWRTG